MGIPHFVYLNNDGHLGLSTFWLLWLKLVLRSVYKNLRACFQFLWYLLKRAITGSNSKSMIRFLRDPWTLFHSGCTISHSYLQCMRILIPSYSPHWVLCSGISLWFWFGLPIWLAVLSTVSFNWPPASSSCSMKRGLSPPSKTRVCSDSCVPNCPQERT